MAHDNLVADFQAYSQWRGNLTQSISQLQRWLGEQDLDDVQTNLRIGQLIDKLRDDKLNIAFVAEFSRGKSELINSIFFADYGQRILPSSAGRTTMCPTELMYDANRPAAIELLPIESRGSELTVSDYRRQPQAWERIPLDTSTAEGMLDAFAQVGQVKRVTVDEARRLGLYDDSDPDMAVTVGADGMLDIPHWRHAIINFPHPLLKQGLVILDTPGLNAIGAEPELTLNLLPNAHAILFILAADTGVTKTDIDVWRSHVSKVQGGRRGRIVVLNKIDGQWDELKRQEEIDAEIARQVKTSAELLGVPVSQVFPVSAQKGLVAKINHDPVLLAKSRLARLEYALSEELLPAKQEIVRDNTQTEIEDVVLAVRGILGTRRSGLQGQLDELSSLRGKNREVIHHMLDKVQEEKLLFERGMQRFQALRSVFTQQTNVLYTFLGMEALKKQVKQTRADMEASTFSAGLTAAMGRFFKDTNANISKSAEQIAEIQAMMAAMYKKFSDEHGLGSVTPPPFSTLKYHKEITRLERTFREHFNTLGTILTTGQQTLIKKFFETVASRVSYVYEVANRDVDNWLKAVMAPMETQVREHQLQLRRRLESVKRIHKATDSLEGQIVELQQGEAHIKQQLADIDRLLQQVYAVLHRDMQTATV